MVASVERLQDSWHGELGVSFRDAFFTDEHPWSQTSRGRAQVIESLSAQDLRDEYASRFGASQSVLAIFGDVDPAQVAKAVEELFKDIPSKPKVVFDPLMPPPPVEGIHQVLTKKPLAAVQIGYGPGATRRSPDYPVLRVLTRVLSSFPSGWLEAQLRGSAGDGLVYGVWSYPMTGLVPGCLVIGFNTSPPQIVEAIKRTRAVVQRARETKVDDQTLTRAKAGVLVSQVLGQQSNGDRAMTAALDDLYGLGVDASQRFIEEVRAMTAEQLQFAARMYLRNPVTVVLTNEPMGAAPTSQPASNANAE
jgi:zinc protease